MNTRMAGRTSSRRSAAERCFMRAIARAGGPGSQAHGLRAAEVAQEALPAKPWIGHQPTDEQLNRA
jgi:hypothetical protein